MARKQKNFILTEEDIHHLKSFQPRLEEVWNHLDPNEPLKHSWRQQLFPGWKFVILDFYFTEGEGKCDVCDKSNDDLKIIKPIYPIHDDEHRADASKWWGLTPIKDDIRICKKCLKKEKINELIGKYFKGWDKYKIWSSLEEAYLFAKNKNKGKVWDLAKQHDKALRFLENEEMKALEETGNFEELRQRKKEIRLYRRARKLQAMAFRNEEIDDKLYWEFRDEEAFNQMLKVFDKLIEIAEDPTYYEEERDSLIGIKEMMIKEGLIV